MASVGRGYDATGRCPVPTHCGHSLPSAAMPDPMPPEATEITRNTRSRGPELGFADNRASPIL